MKELPVIEATGPSIRFLDMDLPDGELSPKGADRAVIIPMHDDAERACRIAEEYCRAGVLTLGMSPVRVDDDVTCFDGIMYMDDYGSRMMSEELIKILELNGPIKFGVGDLPQLLHDNCRFMINQYSVRQAEEPFSELLGFMAEDFADLKVGAGNSIAIIFTVNPRGVAVTADDIRPLCTSGGFVPGLTELMWGLHYDDSLPMDKVSAIAIITGEIEIKRINQSDGLIMFDELWKDED